MSQFRQLIISVILFMTTAPLLARDYSYMNDHTAAGDVITNTSPDTLRPSTSTPSTSTAGGSIVNSIIDAAVTTGVETADQTIGADKDSFSGRFYNNFRKGDQEQLPSGEGVYIREDDGWKHDNRNNDRNRRDWGRSQGKGKAKGKDKKWRKEQYKRDKKLHKEQDKSERKNKYKNKKYDYDDTEEYRRSKRDRHEYYKQKYND